MLKIFWMMVWLTVFLFPTMTTLSTTSPPIVMLLSAGVLLFADGIGFFLEAIRVQRIPDCNKTAHAFAQAVGLPVRIIDRLRSVRGYAIITLSATRRNRVVLSEASLDYLPVGLIY
jgi:hypothetical protein